MKAGRRDEGGRREKLEDRRGNKNYRWKGIGEWRVTDGSKGQYMEPTGANIIEDVMMFGWRKTGKRGICCSE